MLNLEGIAGLTAHCGTQLDVIFNLINEACFVCVSVIAALYEHPFIIACYVLLGRRLGGEPL